MLSERSKIDYAKSYLRRNYNLAGLQALSATVYASATDTVTLTSANFEGGAGSGVVTFEKASLGIAIEELIAALGATPAVRSRSVFTDFSRGFIAT